MFYIFLIGLFTVIFVILIIKAKDTKNLCGKHVMVSGGSSGIGLSVAKQIVLLGGNVTLVARNEKKLLTAKTEIEKMEPASEKPLGKVQIYPGDVSGPRSALSKIVSSAETNFGSIYMLVNCAGFSKPGRFEDLAEEDVKAMMNVNCLGSFFLTQEVVTRMKKNDNGGIIVFVSSQGGLLGIYGFTAYAASKSAIIRLAEALHMELKPYNISVTVNCPPDTDTPGFEEENKAKPAETSAISESGGLYQPDEIAKLLLRDALQGNFLSSPGLEGFLLKTICAGMGPLDNAFNFLCQVMLSPVMRIASAFYLLNFGSIIMKMHREKQNEKKQE